MGGRGGIVNIWYTYYMETIQKCKCGKILLQKAKQCRECWKNSLDNLDERLNKFIDKKENGCWIFTGAKDKLGYGRMSINKKTVLSHRLAWLIKYGEYPDECLCHKCDTPSCVNPDHLFVGTRLDNNLDMKNKGRMYILKPQIGSKHPMSKLIEKDIEKIRELYKKGMSRKDINKQFKQVSYSTIKLIISNKIWKNVQN